MWRPKRYLYRGICWLAFFCVMILTRPPTMRGEVITLKNGLQLQGRLARVSSLNQNPLVAAKSEGNVDVSKIVLVDDDLRRTFVSSNQVRIDGIVADADLVVAKLSIPKRVAQGTRRIGLVGPIIEITPFDEFGNRTFSMQGPNGRLDVIQGITLITPHYTQVEGLAVKNAYEWDMRISTAAIPRETLSQVLLRFIDQADSNERLRVVTMYIQAQRYRDALVELNRIIKDFPDLRDLEKERARLYQLVAADVIREIELRSAAGQHGQARALLTEFPAEDVAGELLLKVSDLLRDYEGRYQRRDRALELLESHRQESAEHHLAPQIASIADEIRGSLTINNLDRVSDYLRLADDDELTAEQKLALVITGWLMGGGSARLNLAESLSLVEVRDVVRSYLRVEHQVERGQLLERLRSLEGATPGNLARIIATMDPPWPVQFPTEGIPGMVELSVPGPENGAEIRYFAQVPPEYDPSRRYPCVVTLHGGDDAPGSNRLVGGPIRSRHASAAGAGDATRVHRPRAGLGAGKPDVLRLLAAGARGGARRVARRETAIEHRLRSRLPERAFHGWGRRLGHRPGPSRSVGGRLAGGRHGGQVHHAVLEERQRTPDVLRRRPIGRQPAGDQRAGLGSLHAVRRIRRDVR